MQNTAKQNYPDSVASYDTRPGNKVGFIQHYLQCSRAHTKPVVICELCF